MSGPGRGDGLPYAHLLKRVPVQARSRARVEAILDAAAELLAEGDIEALTLRAIAAAAGVPTGTIYQFFEDKPALIQAVALRYVAATVDVLDTLLVDDAAPWDVTLADLIDGYADLIAAAPAMRALWLAGAMSATTAKLAGEADDAIAARLQADLTRRVAAGAPSVAKRRRRTAANGGAASDWRFLVTLISGLLELAFADDLRGDRATLARTRRVAVLYAADLLGVPPPPP
ncbi:hypothetical protein DSM112329_04691 [Paraconexibacter sp. AEG42_29]|uniref:HTH tetR-type domain-containing protein n=1 Tax=Paraconexibacter sp. AEG42_29 TaxID=2997339 RepID=A0AAU7B1Q2_9ACTN